MLPGLGLAISWAFTIHLIIIDSYISQSVMIKAICTFYDRYYYYLCRESILSFNVYIFYIVSYLFFSIFFF